MKIISCVHLHKNYVSPKVTTFVLKDINLDIHSGDFCGITGPSGSGKTTLLYTMSGLEKPTSGEVFLFEKEVAQYEPKQMAAIRKTKIGFVFQFYNLIPNLNAYENVKLAQIIAEKNDDPEIDRILGLVGMKEFKEYFPNELSGGMQQRIAIARSLINDPEIIFADEPTGNLDQKNGQEIMGILKMLNRDQHKTIVLVTHSEDNLKYCTRHVKLTDGKIIRDEELPV